MNTGRHNGDETLLVRFYLHPKQNRVKSEAEGRPIFEDTDYIEIMQPGNKDSIIKRPATEMDKQRFAEHYRKYEARQSQDHIEGTVIDQAPFVTRAQVEELKFLNIRTVEQLAGLSDSNAQGIMGIQALKQKAKDWLESASDNATKEALAEQKAINEALLARLDALENEPELTSGQKAALTRKKNMEAKKAAAAALEQPIEE